MSISPKNIARVKVAVNKRLFGTAKLINDLLRQTFILIKPWIYLIP